MQRIEMQLNKFFLDHGGPYTNDTGVSFLYHPRDTSLFITCDVPGLQLPGTDFTVDLNTNHPNLFHFIHEYVVTELEDLQTITPHLLLKRFIVGKASLLCCIDPEIKSFLHFKRKGDVLWAKDNEEQKHQVPLHLNRPDELLVYTQHYYELKFM